MTCHRVNKATHVPTIYLFNFNNLRNNTLTLDGDKLTFVKSLALYTQISNLLRLSKPFQLIRQALPWLETPPFQLQRGACRKPHSSLHSE